jgi:hypothetical protein
MERSFFSIATAKLKILGKEERGFILSRLTDGYVMVRLSPQGAIVATQYRQQQKIGGCLATLGILIDAAGIVEVYQALCLIVGQWCSEKEPLKSAAVADAFVSVGRQPEKPGQPLTDTRPVCATPIEIVCHLTEYISLDPKVGSITAAKDLLASFVHNASTIAISSMYATAGEWFFGPKRPMRTYKCCHCPAASACCEHHALWRRSQ